MSAATFEDVMMRRNGRDEEGGHEQSRQDGDMCVALGLMMESGSVASLSSMVARRGWGGLETGRCLFLVLGPWLR